MTNGETTSVMHELDGKRIAVTFTRREHQGLLARPHLARIVVGLMTVFRLAGRGVFLFIVATVGCTTFDVTNGYQFADLRLRQELKDDLERVLATVSAEHKHRLRFAPVEVGLDAAEQNLCRFEKSHAGKDLPRVEEVNGDRRLRHQAPPWAASCASLSRDAC